MHDLAAELNAFMDGLLERAAPATAQLFATTQGREAPVRANSAIDVGALAPGFTLPDAAGRPVDLAAALERGPVVLLFVRGGWCPFCALTLRAYDRLLAALRAEGATLIAISPQTQANNLSTGECNALHFPMLSDHGLEVAARYGLVWEPDAAMQSILKQLGHDVPRINGAADWRLPIPAGFVIGQDGLVLAAHQSANIADRLPPAEALAAVRALATRGDAGVNAGV